MASQITLKTSDDPPVQLTVPYSALVTNSIVFHDLLSLPATSSSDEDTTSLDVAETDEEIKPFLSVLCGKGASELGGLKQEGWQTLARLADKYDSETARLVIREHAAEHLLDENECPVNAFVLAVLSQASSRLLKLAALEVLTRASLEAYRKARLEPFLENLATWGHQLRKHADSLIDNSDFEAPGCDVSGEDCNSEVNQEQWARAMEDAVCLFNEKNPFSGHVQQGLKRARACSDCKEEMEDEARGMDKQYREGMPAFPV